jgi:CIC family chloride channel protein
MVACAVSYLVAESLFPRSLYEHLLEAKGIVLTEDKPSRDFMAQMKANQVMQADVETLAAELSLAEVLPIMSRSHHRGFPVTEEGRLVGVFTQTDLANAQTQPQQTPLRDLMTPNPITVVPEAPLSDVLYLLNRYQLSRLPVVRGSKLIGIITRTDIIREEVGQLGGQLSLRPTPVYSVYQTRAPSLGETRILLPLANPQRAAALFQVASAIAAKSRAEIDCLQVIKIPKAFEPSEFVIPTLENRKLLQRLERLGRHQHLLVNTQILLAHHIAVAILETIRDRQIKLLILGWKGARPHPNSIFSNVVDTLIEKAPCDLLLVKLGKSASAYPKGLHQSATWLIPVAGGPNVQRALDFLPALLSLYTHPQTPEILLSKVYLPSDRPPNYDELQDLAERLQSQLPQTITPIPLCSRSVTDAIASLAAVRRCDVILIGSSKEGLLQNVLQGNIPTLIAEQVESTVLIFRSALSSSQALPNASQTALFEDFSIQSTP